MKKSASKKASSKREDSPTKKAEARAMKQDSLKGVDTKASAPKKETGRPTIPVGQMPIDAIR